MPNKDKEIEHNLYALKIVEEKLFNAIKSKETSLINSMEYRKQCHVQRLMELGYKVEMQQTL